MAFPSRRDKAGKAKLGSNRGRAFTYTLVLFSITEFRDGCHVDGSDLKHLLRKKSPDSSFLFLDYKRGSGDRLLLIFTQQKKHLPISYYKIHSIFLFSL